MIPRALRRVLKGLLAEALPEPIKKRLRAPLYGYRPPRVVLPVEFTEDNASACVRVSHPAAAFTLRFNQEQRPMVRTHLVDHGAAVEEMSNFIALAAGARTFFDVGADLAVFSNTFCAIDPRNRAVAFEPSAGRVDSAREFTLLNGFTDRIAFRSCALQRAPGHAAAAVFADRTVVVGATPDGRTFGSEEWQPVGTVDVDISSVDAEVAALGVVPDLLKIDVEGDEYEVLLGARKLLRERKPAICLELHLDLLERRGLSAALVVDELVSLGYRFRTCTGRSLSRGQVAGAVHSVLRFVAE